MKRQPCHRDQLLSVLLLIGLTLSACTAPESPEATLKSAFAESFMVGAALNEAQFSGQAVDEAAIVMKHFNTITPENTLKWESVHPEPDSFNFGPADAYVSFGEENGMFIVGHALVWHHQTPQWVFQDENGEDVDRETLLNTMQNHILTVVGRYKGRIDGWDVVNEALNDDGTLRETAWLRIIGDDYIAKAFEYAREADPDVQLYYNDYSLPDRPKRDGTVALITNLQERGIDVAGVGLQGHYKLTSPGVAQLDSSIAAFAAMGVDVMITELDIDVLPAAWEHRGADLSLDVELHDALNPYTEALPDSMQHVLATRYAELFGVFQKNADVVTRVTFWGVTDQASWLNSWPVEGRTSYPLLFDRSNNPKHAYDMVIAVAG
ncbi:MAG: endo-1,4-beta-xylanase [Rhodothermales bacterium]|nr:endo-1,4-beta-xylanase [Rhodothermales bacterium]